MTKRTRARLGFWTVRAHLLSLGGEIVLWRHTLSFMGLRHQIGRLDNTGGREESESSTASQRIARLPACVVRLTLDCSLLHILDAELVEFTAL